MQDRSPLLSGLFGGKRLIQAKHWEKTMGHAIDQPHGPLLLLVTPFQQQTSVILDTGSSNLIIPSTFNELLRDTQQKIHPTKCDSMPINCDGSASVSFSANSLGKPLWKVDSPAFSTRVYQLRASSSDWKSLDDTDSSPLLYDIVPAEPALRKMGWKFPNNVAPLKYTDKCVICVRQGQRAARWTNGFQEKVRAAAEFATRQGRPLDTNHFADKNGKGVKTVRCTSPTRLHTTDGSGCCLFVLLHVTVRQLFNLSASVHRPVCVSVH
jgi:hypothetical protein